MLLCGLQICTCFGYGIKSWSKYQKSMLVSLARIPRQLFLLYGKPNYSLLYSLRSFFSALFIPWDTEPNSIPLLFFLTLVLNQEAGLILTLLDFGIVFFSESSPLISMVTWYSILVPSLSKHPRELEPTCLVSYGKSNSIGFFCLSCFQTPRVILPFSSIHA